MPEAMPLFEHQFKAMGSPCLIQCFCLSERVAKQWFEEIQQEVERLEQKYSRYRNESLLSQINEAAGSEQPTTIDAETYGLLHYAEQAFELSDGLFDITSGVLRRTWDFKSAKIPTKTQIDAIMGLIGWKSVQWSKDSIYLPRKGMEIDFGGIVKEYAVDRCVAILTAKHVKAMVNLGGDIGVTPCAPVDHVWDIGIRHPRRGQTDKIATMPLTKGAIAASGDYERFIEHQGKRYSHILNPKTGYPVTGLATACIWAERCVLAGTLTTIAMLKGEEGLDWLRSLQMPYLAVDYDMQVYGDL
jgi:thiamine biosynthesis lipoprotein